MSGTGSFVAEIIGPAGSGKSSLSQILREQQDIRTGLSVWRLRSGLLMTSALRSLPSLFSLCVERKRFDWEDLKLVIKHNALLQLLRTETTKGYQAVLLDEGNVFALAKLHAFKPASPTQRSVQKLFKDLATRLNAVIWLDAPDDVLAQRIRERDKPHRMKDRTDAEIQNHLSSYRRAFEQVVAELSQLNGLKVFRYRTDELPLQEIARRIQEHARAEV